MRFRLLAGVLGLTLAILPSLPLPAAALMDGVVITTPDVAIWDPAKRQWVIENYGVDPDIQVENAPSEVIAGHDPPLERAIQWCLDELQKSPPQKPQRPPYKVQEGLR